MLNEVYPAVYRDTLGEVITTISNDGKELRMKLRNVDFVGTMLDDFEPCLPYNAPELHQFTFEHTQRLTPPSTVSPLWVLCDFTLEWSMPVPFVINGERYLGSLQTHFELGLPRSDNRAIDREVLQLTLHAGDQQFASQGGIGDFGGELADIQRQLPENMYIEICFFCAFSDYNPSGNGEFGGLDCFRKAKQEYLALKGKRAWALYGKKIDERVQETYHCPEFEQRTVSFGRYYGQHKK